MKYYYRALKTIDGEREYYHKGVVELEDNIGADKWLEDYCKDFWGDDGEWNKEDGYADFLDIHCYPERIYEISKDDYETLKKHI